MLSKLPEQDSNLRPPALEDPWEPFVGAILAARALDLGEDSQADGAKSDAEGATKSQSAWDPILGSCELCGRYRKLTVLGRGDYVVWLCDECHEEDRTS